MPENFFTVLSDFSKFYSNQAKEDDSPNDPFFTFRCVRSKQTTPLLTGNFPKLRWLINNANKSRNVMLDVQ